MSDKITFTVNGFKKTVELAGWEKVLDILREEIGLTGTKRGCDDGSCGACTVLLDGKAVKSCLFPAKKIDGKNITTIEGVSGDENLHPVQKALIESGAVQCGYCTPGIVLELIALFGAEPGADDEKIKDALAKHLCRCTGYESIFEGAKLARKYLKEQMGRKI